jgi:hypothetical protein
MKPTTTRARFHLRQGFGGLVAPAIAGISVAISIS